MTRTPPQVLVLNGGSSSGKTTLARLLQEPLPGTWLRLGVDTLVDAAPPRLLSGDGLVLEPDGGVVVGDDFVAVEQQWRTGIAAMVRAGARVIVEDNFVSGPAGQQGWHSALSGLSVGWVGVRCDAAVVAAREAARGDRTPGMAAAQAESVHDGITYDLEVDTGRASTEALVQTIRERFFARG
ncbi:chloramphenicol phosphotransferase CPT family protein [Nocardioides sp. Root140]|uniref:chloramphenicol phosphotransferase CPT family protein n=1 Tax=Nocardioides sp. Root140 TaxID=1736460 RepID=UPI000A97DCAA|nr:AAA family ATPase [Nocardioides sp. Root140]